MIPNFSVPVHMPVTHTSQFGDEQSYWQEGVHELCPFTSNEKVENLKILSFQISKDESLHKFVILHYKTSVLPLYD